MLSILINILLFVLVIGTLTFVHELGHFVTAKMVGAKVFEFALGFGPKLLSKKFKGTLYSIRIFPLGGFVKILGDGDPGKEEKGKGNSGDLSKKPKYQQIIVMLAGVTMNILLAIILYFIVIGTSGWKLVLGNEFESFNPVGASISREREGEVEYGEVIEGNGASEAKIPEKGVIQSIDGNKIEYSDEVGKYLGAHKEQSVTMKICSEENCSDYLVKVSKDGKIGIALASNYFVILSYEGNKILSGPSHLVNTVRLIGIKLGEIIANAKSTGDYTELSNSVSGPIGIYFVIDYFKDFGLIPFLSIIADLSLSLAIVNLLPIPALDGGRVLILKLEWIFRRDLDERIEAIIINISFVLLMILILFIIIKDVVNIDSIKNMFL
ncbi:MAG: RIP metalloprotease [Candidatus Dojkabacteria bacterium]